MIKSIFIEFHVQNLENHKKLFTEVLDFKISREEPNFITLSNGIYKVLLTHIKFEVGHQFYEKLNPNTNGYGVEIGIIVDDLEFVYNRFLQFKQFKTITEIKLQEWGKQDFRVTTMDNYYIRFSQFKAN
ncbi:MAG: VOC family protein [Saprospiraceae bacterium]|jgi:hypothetical protein|nr:VOC family protein [Saprospiraceae bacterium]